MTSFYKWGYAYGITAALIWSGFILVSRMGGVSALGHYDIIAIRYATCTLILLPFWLFYYRFNVFKPKYILIAVIGGIGYALCTFQAFQLAPASHAALLLPGAMPIFAVIIASLFRTETISAQKWFGVAIITFGITLLFVTQSNFSSASLGGDLLFLMGALCWTVMSVLIKHWSITPWQVTVCLAILTCMMYLPIYIFLLPKNISIDLMPDIVLQMIYQGFLATIVQMLLFAEAVYRLGAATMGSLMALVPIIAGLGAFLVLDEPATLTVMSGLALVALGAWTANIRIRHNT